MPNPVPNEVVLLCSGYLSSVGKLHCLIVLITVIAADVTGSSFLYTTCYCLGQRLLQKWPHVMPSSKLTYLTARVAHQNRWSIYVGRHIPFIRGYTAVAAGLLKMPPRIFLPVVLLSALTWSGGYVIAGTLLGYAYVDVAMNYWKPWLAHCLYTVSTLDPSKATCRSCCSTALLLISPTHWHYAMYCSG